ncbi:MAG: hypothetical protein U5J78_02370 [Parasphingorhabdus sp.]|nr:hypothetical protein [Parasphingorhabdus sp.]
MKKFMLAVIALVGVTACASEPAPAPQEKTQGFALPAPITNNAVALLDGTIYSFNGLRKGKSWVDTSHSATACRIADAACQPLPDVPVPQGRLASAAVAAGGKIYIFGGYTVEQDGDEVSTPEVFAFNPADNSYARVADMPTPVDDMVALSYADRYIFLISGWHDEGNVSVVQLYDTQTDSWQEATAFPGTPVFGHAGGIAGNSMIVAGGTAVLGLVDGKRKFGAINLAWRGEIDPANPARISWRGVKPLPGNGLYRAAAVGDNAGNRILFAGGANAAYNYDGIGYDGTPAEAAQAVFAYDLGTDKWIGLGNLAAPAMDLRGGIWHDGTLWLVGGMDQAREVTARIMAWRPVSKEN